jgi:hypothetical protein
VLCLQVKANIQQALAQKDVEEKRKVDYITRILRAAVVPPAKALGI